MSLAPVTTLELLADECTFNGKEILKEYSGGKLISAPTAPNNPSKGPSEAFVYDMGSLGCWAIAKPAQFAPPGTITRPIAPTEYNGFAHYWWLDKARHKDYLLYLGWGEIDDAKLGFVSVWQVLAIDDDKDFRYFYLGTDPILPGSRYAIYESTTSTSRAKRIKSGAERF